MLNGGSEERRGRYFFPQVKTNSFVRVNNQGIGRRYARRLIPVGFYVVEVELDDGPQCVSDIRRVILSKKKIRPGDESIGS